MPKKMLIDATHAEETRVVVVDGNKVEEFDFESENKRQLAGNIYLAKVSRVEPSLQAAFVDYGGNRHGFLAFSEIHPDYYQIPVADREALMEEERAYAEEQEAERAREDDDEKPARARRTRGRSKAERTTSDDAVTSASDTGGGDGDIAGMETIDLDTDDGPHDDTGAEGLSPMETVQATPVEEPAEATADAARDEDESAAETGNGDGDGNGEDPDTPRTDAVSKDDSIESVADDDDQDDIRPPRRPRPRRYKIQEVIKVRQILLVQVVKEERGNKGAALTTYLSLAGRYCVLMPNTARGGGISRKITTAADRKKLKQIAAEIDVPRGAGLIIRTAGAKRTKAEINRDYEYLQRLWEQIRELTLRSIAPAKIYEEGNLIKRSIRDLYNREIDEVLVEGMAGYRVAKDFMKMIMPSHAKNVKHYQESMPLFARYQVESYLNSMFNPVVQLRSGGYIVIGVTEALVAIDVNSGKATKEGSVEETALKTNLEAADEVARQLRLRDLAGLIVIDFIDMDERRNNAAVEKRFKDKLKSDRARIQVGRISGFGLLEMSRQRLRPGMIEASTQPCPHCHGTGLIRSDDSMALAILRQIEEEGVRRRSREVLVRAPVSIANFLINYKREHVANIEARYGLAVRIEGDPGLVSPDFTLEKFKTATRPVPEAAPVVSVDTTLMDEVSPEPAEPDTDAAPEAESVAGNEAAAPTTDEEAPKPKKRRRRRRRKPKARTGEGEPQQTDDGTSTDTADEGATPDAETPREPEVADSGDVTGAADTATAPDPDAAASAKPKRSRKPRSSARKKPADPAPEATPQEPQAPAGDSEDGAPSDPMAAPVAAIAAEPAVEAAGVVKPAHPEPTASDMPDAQHGPGTGTDDVSPVEPAPAAQPALDPGARTGPEPVEPAPAEPETVATTAAPDEEAKADKSRRRGWWSVDR